MIHYFMGADVSMSTKTNWRAMQVPKDDKKQPLVPHGVRKKYLAMGSWKHKART